MQGLQGSGVLKGFTIVVAGKGGTGKTLVSALLVRDQRKHGAVLAIDADPDSNLPEALGIDAKVTVGGIRESILDYRSRRNDNPAVTAERLFEQRMMEAVIEQKGFDLLVMGRGEGEGCYCAVNHILRGIIDMQARHYPTVVIDSEAGLEHISRRTARDVDVMLVVTDASARGVGTARRVAQLAQELNVTFGRTVMLVNKVTGETRAIMARQAEEAELEVIGFLPYDPRVAENDALGRSVWELPEDGPVLQAAREVFARLDAIRADRLAKAGFASDRESAGT
jgi:CO dehydrogenase maturation factor